MSVNTNKVPGVNPWHHIVYISILFIIILICVIVCMSKERVCQSALDNVTFAATIVSIVLAVISIVISVYASFSTYNNLGGLSKTEESLSKIVERLSNMELTLANTKKNIDDICSKLAPTPLEQIERLAQKEAHELNNHQKSNSSGGKAIYTMQEIMSLQNEAVKKAASKFNLDRLMLNTHYRGIRGYIFDGIGFNGNNIYIIEVKLYHRDIKTSLKLMSQKIEMLEKEISEPIHVILVFIAPDGNDIEAIRHHVSEIVPDQISSVKITTLIYSFSDLQTGPAY